MTNREGIIGKRKEKKKGYCFYDNRSFKNKIFLYLLHRRQINHSQKKIRRLINHYPVKKK